MKTYRLASRFWMVLDLDLEIFHFFKSSLIEIIFKCLQYLIFWLSPFIFKSCFKYLCSLTENLMFLPIFLILLRRKFLLHFGLTLGNIPYKRCSKYSSLDPSLSQNIFDSIWSSFHFSLKVLKISKMLIKTIMKN